MVFPAPGAPTISRRWTAVSGRVTWGLAGHDALDLQLVSVPDDDPVDQVVKESAAAFIIEPVEPSECALAVGPHNILPGLVSVVTGDTFAGLGEARLQPDLAFPEGFEVLLDGFQRTLALSVQLDEPGLLALSVGDLAAEVLGLGLDLDVPGRPSRLASLDVGQHGLRALERRDDPVPDEPLGDLRPDHRCRTARWGQPVTRAAAVLPATVGEVAAELPPAPSAEQQAAQHVVVGRSLPGKHRLVAP
jgi:hypothetical protein